MSRAELSTYLVEPFVRGDLPSRIPLVGPKGSTQVLQGDLHYTLDVEGQEYMTGLIARYRPDFASFVALDAETGRILSMVSYHRDPADEIYGNLSLRAIFPAASIFKVVTAAAALDMERLKPETVIAFNGGSHTLYKRNVTETKYNRWTRTISLKEAFAKSINTVFGKIGAFHVGPKSLLDYAQRFQFDKPIASELPVETGFAFKPEAGDAFEIAEAASGFNKESRMSPLQGALIASAVANDGVMMPPYLVEQMLETGTGRLLYQHQDAPATVTMRPESALKLRELMGETVEAGTSRKSFRQVFGKKLWQIPWEMGGKTGSLTASRPEGKVDWFVGYARGPKQKIAIAAMTLHKQYWTVKSSYLGASFFEHYFKRNRVPTEGLRAPAAQPAAQELEPHPLQRSPQMKIRKARARKNVGRRAPKRVREEARTDRPRRIPSRASAR